MSLILNIALCEICVIIGLICGAGGTAQSFERKIKSGYIQVDNKIYETRVVLQGKEFDEEAR